MKPVKHKRGSPEKVHLKQNIQTKNQFKIEKYFDIIGILIMILIGTIIYSNSFDCPFQFDDKHNLVDNDYVKSFSFKAIWNYYSLRVIPLCSLALNYHFGQLNVFGYHLVNLMIHLVNSCLVWWLTLLLFSSPYLKNIPLAKHKKAIGLFTALLFVSHPLATQSVTYIVQRMASMATLFYFLSLALYLKARINGKFNGFAVFLYSSASISAILAFLSKENAFTLPITILIVELFFFRTLKITTKIKDKRIWIPLVIFFILISFILAQLSFKLIKPISPDEFSDYKVITPQNYLYSQFYVIVKYIQLLILPINQNFDYDIPLSNNFLDGRTISCFIFLISLMAMAVFLFNKNRIISFGIFWFFITLSVESSIIPISDLMYEHRTYLPSLGFFLILISFVFHLFGNKTKYAFVILTVIICINSYLAFERNKVWKDEFTLWNDAVLKSPNKARPLFNRGHIFDEKNKKMEAIKDYSKAIEVQPKYVNAYYNRGILYESESNIDLEIKDYSKVIELDNSYYKAYNNRANLSPNFEMALKDYNKAIEINPKFYQAYFNRGNLLQNNKRNEEASRDYDKAIEFNPGYGKAYFNRGLIKYNAGIKDSACMDWKKAVQCGYEHAAEIVNKYCQ